MSQQSKPANPLRKAASALRETMWSMVSEVHSTLPFNYAAYTDANLATYAAAFHTFKTL